MYIYIWEKEDDMENQIDISLYKNSFKVIFCTVLLFSVLVSVSLFKGISTFVSYLTPNPSFQKNSKVAI